MQTLLLENVRCFRSVELPLDAPLTVLIGDNGSGKTTLAEAVASLAHGDDEGLRDFPLRQGARAGRMYIREGETIVAEWRSDAQERRRLPEDRWVFAYGRYRRVVLPRERSRLGPALLPDQWAESAYYSPWKSDPVGAARKRRTASLSDPRNGLLDDVGLYLRDLDELRSFQPLVELAWTRLNAFVRSLGEGFEGFRLVDRGDTSVAVLVRDGVELGLSELSDGYQAVLVIVLDLLRRYVEIFRGRPDPFEGEALVVIDEVDLHLHPRWQRLIVRQLRELFPRTRFLLTTHSMAVVQGAIDQGDRVYALHGGGEVQTLGERKQRTLRGAELGSLAVEDRLFDLPSRYSVATEDLEREVVALRKRLARRESAEVRRELLKKLEALQVRFAEEEARRAKGTLLTELGRSQLAMLKQLEAQLAEGER